MISRSKIEFKIHRWKTQTRSLDLRTANMNLDHWLLNLEAQTQTSKLESASHISRPWSQAGCQRLNFGRVSANSVEPIFFSAAGLVRISRCHIFHKVYSLYMENRFFNIFHIRGVWHHPRAGNSMENLKKDARTLKNNEKYWKIR